MSLSDQEIQVVLAVNGTEVHKTQHPEAHVTTKSTGFRKSCIQEALAIEGTLLLTLYPHTGRQAGHRLPTLSSPSVTEDGG